MISSCVERPKCRARRVRQIFNKNIKSMQQLIGKLVFPEAIVMPRIVGAAEF